MIYSCLDVCIKRDHVDMDFCYYNIQSGVVNPLVLQLLLVGLQTVGLAINSHLEVGGKGVC